MLVDSHDGDGIVIEHSRDVFRRELVCCVADEKAGLSDGTISDHNTSAKRDSG
jgi:hypothetical protein